MSNYLYVIQENFGTTPSILINYELDKEKNCFGDVNMRNQRNHCPKYRYKIFSEFNVP